MEISQDALLCAGEYSLTAPAGKAAIVIAASDVTLDCEEGTVIASATGTGSTESPLVGIGIEGQSNVTVTGCTVKGFRYGLAARSAENVVLAGVHFDDNFTDPSAGWVQDTVQGGGIRFEEVSGGEIKDSSFARNWNGLELRKSRDITVTGNKADHCSNTGVTLVDSHDSTFDDNDFSWGIRGDDLSYLSNWYGVDTKDSAGLIVDAGSTGNRFTNNDFTYGGDGIFVRSVIGGCPTDNWFEGNDTSFSPHNAIECWCDRNAFVSNNASDSHYGIWLGGTDEGIVRGNTVERSMVDGISIQIGEDRHTIIEGNTIKKSGRVGLLLTGREYQAWHNLSHWADRLANSSHLVVQNNTFSDNHSVDIFVSSTRSLVLASNCGDDGNPTVRKENESELIVTASDCGAGLSRTSPTAELAPQQPMAPGDTVTVTATNMTTQDAVDTLAFTWLVQPSGLKFAPQAFPAAILAQELSSESSQELTFSSPGVYDVNLTVTDGYLAGMAHQQIFVEPEGTRVGTDAATWSHVCASASCTTTIENGDRGVHISTNAPYDFAAITPVAKDLGVDASGVQHVGFFARAWNNNGLGWQGNYPVVVLGGPAGTTTYSPKAPLLTSDGREWIYVEVPISGNASWDRSGPQPSTIDWIEIHSDTYGWDPVELWIDGLTLY